MDGERWAEATASMKAAVAASPDSVWKNDGLGHSPRDTATALYRSLIESNHADQANDLHAHLSGFGLELDT